MVLKWIKSKSTVKPKEIDYESSPTTVYVRKNIVETEDKDEFGQATIFFEYDEAQLTHEEYQLYAAEKTQKDSAKIMKTLADIYEKLNNK